MVLFGLGQLPVAFPVNIHLIMIVIERPEDFCRAIAG
jgi:hypothetical protein